MYIVTTLCETLRHLRERHGIPHAVLLHQYNITAYEYILFVQLVPGFENYYVRRINIMYIVCTV